MALPRLNRGSQRIVFAIGGLFLIIFLYTLSQQPTSYIFDASSLTDRRASTGGNNPLLLEEQSRSSNGGPIGWFKKTFLRASKPAWLRDAGAIPSGRPQQHGPATPNYSRLQLKPSVRTHRGQSRISIKGSKPEEFELGPLPTIEEANARLGPIMKEIKEKVQQIPREHELWSSIFPPFVNREQQKRYQHLRADWDGKLGKWVEIENRWMMVTVCKEVAGMLGDWFNMWTVLADFLGPETLVISLLEGGSTDGSGEILTGAMRDHLLFIGIPPGNIFIKTMLPEINWDGHHRIELLADMRNAGMQPFYDTLPEGLSPDGQPWTGVIFHNDVYLGPVHILELMHQHIMQGSDMTCGWDQAGKWFYDGWVGRDMAGDLYTPFPVPDEEQVYAQKLFPSSPSTRDRHIRHLPYQVFAAWNGVAVMRPEPFYPPYNVRFRRGKPTGLPESYDHRKPLEDQYECQQSESSFISWDFWKYGFGRIAVVPGVVACYGKEDARLRGILDWPEPDEKEGWYERIMWDDEPPRKVRCHDWPDKLGKGYWAWDTIRWVDPPALVIPDGMTSKPHREEEEQSTPLEKMGDGQWVSGKKKKVPPAPVTPIEEEADLVEEAPTLDE